MFKHIVNNSKRILKRFTKAGLLSVHIDDYGVKLLQLSKSKHVSSISARPLKEGSVVNGVIKNEADLVATIRASLLSALPNAVESAEDVALAISSEQLYLFILPARKKDDKPGVLQKNIEAQIPVPLSNLMWKTMVIDSQGRLLFVGIPRKTIVSFQSVFSKLGLQLRNIELDTAAIAKSLLKRKKRSVLFVCVKKSKTHLSIVSTAGMVLWSITKPIGRTHLEQQGSQEKLLLAIVFMKEFAKAELETELEEIAFTGLGKHKKLRKEVEQGMSLRPLPLHLSKDLAGITMTPTEAIQYAPVLALAFSNGRIDSGLQLAALEKVELTGSLPRAEKAKQLGETKKQHVLSTSSAKNGKHAIGEHTSTYVGMAVAVFSLLLFYMGIVTGVTGQKMEADITHTGSSAYGEVRVEETEEEESFIQSSFSYGQAEAEDGQSSIDSSFKYSVQD